MSEDYPRTLLELERRFSREEACAAYLGSLRWPRGWVCPRCAGQAAWSVATCPLALWPVPIRDVDHRGHDLSGQSSAADDLVPRHVAGNQPEEPHQPFGTTAGVGPGELQDRLGHAPQIAAGDDPSGPRAIAGHRGGGRGVLGR